MSTKKLKVLKIIIALLNVGMGTISVVYDGISLYYTIHHNYTTAALFIGISTIIGVIFLISCNMYDAIVAEMEDRKQHKHKRIQRKIHRAGGGQKGIKEYSVS